MRTLTIEYGDGVICGFDVVDEYGRRCNGLAFEEMLRQVIELAHPRLPEPRHGFRMQTQEEWEREREERAAQLAELHRAAARERQDDVSDAAAGAHWTEVARDEGVPYGTY